MRHKVGSLLRYRCWLSAAIMSQACSSRADTSEGEPVGACSMKTDTLGKAGAWF